MMLGGRDCQLMWQMNKSKPGEVREHGQSIKSIKRQNEVLNLNLVYKGDKKCFRPPQPWKGCMLGLINLTTCEEASEDLLERKPKCWEMRCMSSGHTVRDRAEIYSLRKSQSFDFSLWPHRRQVTMERKHEAGHSCWEFGRDLVES